MARPSTGWSAASPRVRKTFVSSLKSSIQWRTKSSTANSRPHLPGIGAPSPPSVSPLRHRSLLGRKVRKRLGKAKPAPRFQSGFALVRPWCGPAVNPGVATGLPHSILAWAQDCPCQSCCGNRIASPNPALTAGMPRCITSSSDQQGHPRAPTAPRGGLRRRLRAGKSQKDAADDLSDVAASYKGMSEKIRHALLRVPGRKAYDILLPGIGARPRLPGIEASCRAHAKVEILPSKKNVEVVGLDDNRKKIPVVLWGDDCREKISSVWGTTAFGEPARQNRASPPTWRARS